MKICIIPDCGKPIKAKNMCNMHWKRDHIHGDPYYVNSYRKPGEGTFRNGYHLKTYNGEQRSEHVVIVESVLGRKLNGAEEVHHVNRNKADNTKSNLVVCPSRAYHMLIHQRQRAFDASGNASYRKCKFCKTYSDPSAMGIFGTSGYHYSCFNQWRKARYG